MTAGWIALMLGCAVFALANTATACAAWVSWPLAVRRWARAPAVAGARLALLWRMMPLAASMTATLAATGAFAVHEPRGLTEPVGVVLRVLALAGGGLVLAAALRLAGSLVASEWLAYRWTRDNPAVELPGAGGPAWLIDADFPIVAVVGLRRPRLVVARTVAQGCSADELAAIGAHERGHLGAADNFKRLLLQGAVDVLSISRRSRDMTACWQEATENAADDHAAAHGVRAVDLASALVTVARLAPARTAIASVPGSVFYRGGGVERRVRRLLARRAPAGSPPGRPGIRPLAIGLATAVAALIMAGAGRLIYDGAEWLVRILP